MDIRIIPITGGSVTDRFIIYRPLTGLAFVGNRVMAELALSLADEANGRQLRANGGRGAVEFLQAIGFFEPDPPPPPPPGGEFRPTRAVLLLTNQCQLRCTYCYAAAGALPRQELSPELGYAAIDYVCQVAMESEQPGFAVAFHGGGEPTYAWKTLRACTAYARQKPLPAEISLTTNGVWSPRQREWIIANVDGLGISLDGAPGTQDRQRPFISGRGSSDVIMRNIAELDRRGFSYGIRMTATAPWERLPEDVRFIFTETGCRSIQVEPAFNTMRGGHRWPDTAEYRAFAAAFIEAFEIAVRAERRLRYSGARPGKVTTTFCGAPYGALTVNASGALVTCYEVSGDAHPLRGISTIGRIENGQVFVDEAARNRIHALFGERREACQECFCYWGCAGDCYARAFHAGPDGHLALGPRCDMNRSITQQLLLGFISGAGGVWRDVSRQRKRVVHA